MSSHEIQNAAIEQHQPLEDVKAAFACDLELPRDSVQPVGDKSGMTPEARHFVEEYLPDLKQRLSAIMDRPESKDLMDWMQDQAGQADGPLYKLLLQP